MKTTPCQLLNMGAELSCIGVLFQVVAQETLARWRGGWILQNTKKKNNHQTICKTHLNIYHELHATRQNEGPAGRTLTVPCIHDNSRLLEKHKLYGNENGGRSQIEDLNDFEAYSDWSVTKY